MNIHINIRPRLRLSITTKILSMLLALSLVSLGVFAYISLNNMTSLSNYALASSTKLGNDATSESAAALKEQAEQSLEQLARDQADISNALFERVQNETHTLAEYAATLWQDPESTQFNHSYSQYERPDDPKSTSVYVLGQGVSLSRVIGEVTFLGNMDRIFIPVCQKDANILQTYIGTESGIIRIYPWRDGIPDDYDPRQRVWYKNAMTSGKTSWTDLFLDPGTGIVKVSCSEPVYGPDGAIVAVVGTDVSLATMNERILNSQVGQGGYSFVLNGKGDIIAKPDMSQSDTASQYNATVISENLLKSYNASLVQVGREMVAGRSGIFRCNFFNEGEKYIAYAPITSTGWSLGVVMPVDTIVAPAMAAKAKIDAAAAVTQENIAQQISNTRFLFIIILVVMLCVISALAYFLARRITRPILSLRQGTMVVGGGNLDYQLKVKSGDEIEDLAEAFNKMTRDLKDHIRELQQATATKERMESELRIATEIQTSMLPRIFPPFPERKELSVYATMKAAKEIGGDFFDFFFVDKNKLCLLIGDICGKGVPAALFMAISKTLLKTEAQRGLAPDQILSQVNDILYPDNDNSMFFTAFCAILDVTTGEMQYANGGHNPPLLSRRGGTFEFISMPKGFVIGAMPHVKLESWTLKLNPGDVIFMYTDGVTEATDNSNELFSEERLKKALASLGNKSVTDIIKATSGEIEGFIHGAPQSDDITMVVLKYFGPTAS
jgi:sigma-B regulation protein RsbU (phosphoserine phosphatase)